ncbi:MAG: efflux RND transporter periplasmic adaptor subunit [Candidatus Hydrogenedens sp.]|jgi:membrane fusion protein (multidrug efflux system)|nr:efflux RND transporter periplasmic adaptor subunit [Candidatus Hydrogenedens sp.]
MYFKVLFRAALAGVLLSSAVFAQGPPGMGRKPVVTVATVESKTVAVQYEYVGLTAPSKTVEVRARIQGFLDSRDYQEGDYIKKGTRLFTIEDSNFLADREVAAAQVEQAEARHLLSEQELNRLQSITQPGAIAQRDLDQKISEHQSATAALRLARAQLAKAELQLSYTKVDAPLTGYVGKTLKEPGSLVDASQNSLLTIMQQVDPLYVTFKVTESDFVSWRHEELDGRLRRVDGENKMGVEITLLDGRSFTSQGILDFEDINLDTKTGTVELRATFDNKELQLKPGQFVKVLLNGWERPDSIVVPQRSVGLSPQGTYVYTLNEDNTVESTPVTTGMWSGSDWVILDGVKVGDRVIVEGRTKVRPGIEVDVDDGSEGGGAPVSADGAASSDADDTPDAA